MNFLSHFYYTQSTANPYYTMGAVLPDLFRNHHHDWKFHEIDVVPDGDDMSWLIKGWLLHIEVDRIFHSSAPFAAHTSHLRKKLVHVFTEPPKRPFFLAHIGYELILDALLIKNKKVIAAEFYQQLESCDSSVLDRFMVQLGVQDTGGFHKFLKNFIESRYLGNYDRPKSLVHALDQIGRRVWVEKFTDFETKNTIEAIDSTMKELNPAFIDVFHWVEKRLL